MKNRGLGSFFDRPAEFGFVKRAGTVAAYSNHNYYGTHKPLSLRRQKDRFSPHRSYLSFLRILFRRIGLS